MAASKQPVEVLEIIDSSSDEDQSNHQIEPRNRSSSSSAPPVTFRPNVSAGLTSVDSDYVKRKLESRSFWKAGAYDTVPTKFVPLHGELELARVHPKFLHANATSHKWAFGAIAELLDNAVDEIPNGATFIKVDKIVTSKDIQPALLFMDNGGGMDPDRLRKCMSLGYSSKNSNKAIGLYGNGFKTSTMRLGADVIVFSRSTHSGKPTQSVGILSYTFLRKTGHDHVVVPMVDYDTSNHRSEPIIYGSQDEWSSNFKTILEWSPFESKDELMRQFDDIGAHGTKIIVYNLWLNDEGIYELGFDDDKEDIRLRDEASCSSLSKVNKRVLELQSHISYRIRFSLRAYASILYMRKMKNFEIILRGKPVKQLSVADELNHMTTVNYKPQLSSSEEVVVRMTIGFIKEAPRLNISGFNVYHKNRLIMPFWKVTGEGNAVGNGVVGVLEANFIQPAHDKQGFERSLLFLRLEARLKQMVLHYWKGHCHLVGHQPYGRRSSAPPPAIPPAKVQKQNYNQYPLAADLPAVVAPLSDVSVDQIREENIQLFMRCEEYVRKENELKLTVGALEKQLEETRRKSAQLAAHLQARKRQCSDAALQQEGRL